MSQLSFGAGVIYITPTAAVNNPAGPSGIGGAGGGAQGFTSAPWNDVQRMAIVQNVSVDIDLPSKALSGLGQFPIATARGKGKVPIKMEDARLSALMLNALIFGDNTNDITSPGWLVIEGEAGTIPGGSTITVANSARWSRDLGVYDQTTGGKYTATTGTPASGQYTVANGVYTFASADNTNKVFIDYEYQPVGVAPYKVAINQQFKGNSPEFIFIGMGVYLTKQLTIQLNKCVISKASFTFKQEDFLIPSLDAEAYADPVSGTLGSISTAEL